MTGWPCIERGRNGATRSRIVRIASPRREGDARCGLLARVTGVADTSVSAPSAATRARPAAGASRPRRTTSIRSSRRSSTTSPRGSWDRGACSGCDRARAEELNRWAAQSVPTEEDCRDAPPGVAAGGPTLDRIIPAPRHRSGPEVRTWSVGVTTAPRAVPTLADCLASLARAGWDHPRLFVDGDVAVPEAFAHLPRTDRRPQIGAWPNYFLALGELLMREPEADAYMIVQDDSLFADFDVRDYLERVLWPGQAARDRVRSSARGPTRGPSPGGRRSRGSGSGVRWPSSSPARRPSGSSPIATSSSTAGARPGTTWPRSTGGSASGRRITACRSIFRRRASSSTSARSARSGRASASWATAAPPGSSAVARGTIRENEEFRCSDGPFDRLRIKSCCPTNVIGAGIRDGRRSVGTLRVLL